MLLAKKTRRCRSSVQCNKFCRYEIVRIKKNSQSLSSEERKKKRGYKVFYAVIGVVIVR